MAGEKESQNRNKIKEETERQYNIIKAKTIAVCLFKCRRSKSCAAQFAQGASVVKFRFGFQLKFRCA